jgi:DNA-binding transcriptional regulator LsrR (DeoR family)
VADAVTDAELQEIAGLGVRGETCGILLDVDGNAVPSSLTGRLIGIDADQLRAIPDVVGIVYGTSKAGAVRAAIRGGFVKSLVTHTAMAHELLAA